MLICLSRHFPQLKRVHCKLLSQIHLTFEAQNETMPKTLQYHLLPNKTWALQHSPLERHVVLEAQTESTSKTLQHWTNFRKPHIYNETISYSSFKAELANFRCI